MLRKIFLGPNGLRAGWRVALWFLLVNLLLLPIQLGIIFGLGIDPRAAKDAPPEVLLALTGVTIFPHILVTWLFVRFLDRATFSYAGLGGPFAKAARELALGTAFGALLLGLGFAFDAMGGGAAVVGGHADPLRWLVFFAGVAAASASEELSFRGAPFQAVVRGLGPARATALFSLAFGAAHLLNKDVGFFSFANIVAAGVLLSVAFFVRGNLWFPIGLHIGWNVMQGMVLGIPVSGNTGFPSFFVATIQGATWRTGGAFGIEGSAGSLVAISLGLAALATSRRAITRA